MFGENIRLSKNIILKILDCLPTRIKCKGYNSQMTNVGVFVLIESVAAYSLGGASLRFPIIQPLLNLKLTPNNEGSENCLAFVSQTFIYNR